MQFCQFFKTHLLQKSGSVKEITNKRIILAAIIIFLGSILIRWPFLNVPMISDEGGYAYVAQFWSNQYQLYRDIPFDRPQGLFLLYKFALFFGNDIFTIRLFAALYNAVTSVLLFLFSRSMFGQTAGWITGLSYAVFSTSPSIEGFTANAEIFTVLPLAVASYLTWKKCWFGAGLAAGIATIIKPVGISGLLLGLFWASFTRSGLKAWFLIVMGYVIFPLTSIAHGFLIDWNSYWASFVDRRLLLYSVAKFDIISQIKNFKTGLFDTITAWLPLTAGAIASTVRENKMRETWFCLAWFISSFFGMALGGEWFWHYFQQIIPPLSVMAGGAAFDWSNKKLKYFWILSLFVSISCFFMRDLPYWFQRPDKISWKLYHRPGYIYAGKVAEKIKKQTTPDDRIYVAFSEAEIYYLANRRASTQQLYYREVLYSEKIFQLVVDCILNAEPALIVIVQKPPPVRMSTQQFDILIQKHYQFFENLGPITIFERKKS